MPTPAEEYAAWQASLAREEIYFDGWQLTEGTVRDWEYRDGMDGVAGMIGENLTVANRSGEVWRPKVLGAGRFQIAFWLAGDTRQQANDAWRTLLRAVYRPHRLIRVRRKMSGSVDDTEYIFCDAEIIGSIEPTHIGMQGYRATLTFNVPDGVWYSEDLFDHTTTAGSTLPKTLSLPDWAPSTAPLERLQFWIYGRITNPKLVDNTDGGIGDTFTYTGTIPAGGSLLVEANVWQTNATGFTINQSAVNPTGRRLMALSAARPGDMPSVRLEGTNGDAGTRLRVYGRRAYLC